MLEIYTWILDLQTPCLKKKNHHQATSLIYREKRLLTFPKATKCLSISYTHITDVQTSLDTILNLKDVNFNN